MHGRRLAPFLLVSLVLTGCATAYIQGLAALRQGRYDEAASSFQEALAAQPERLEALAGLGIARFKQGAFDEAVDSLGRVVAQRPDDATARLYLALGYLQKRDAFLAEEQLTALQRVDLDSRLAAQVERALDVIRSEPLTDAIRTFVSASLETEADLIRELREARLEARRYGYPRSSRCSFVTRGGRFAVCY